MILTAALAEAVFIPAPLAEDVFLISCAAFLFFLSHIYLGPSMAHLFCASLSQITLTVFWGGFFLRNIFPINIMIKLQQFQLAGITLIRQREVLETKWVELHLSPFPLAMLTKASYITIKSCQSSCTGEQDLYCQQQPAQMM